MKVAEYYARELFESGMYPEMTYEEILAKLYELTDPAKQGGPSSPLDVTRPSDTKQVSQLTK